MYLVYCCAVLCCVVLLSCILPCGRFPRPNTPIAIKGCQVAELYGLGFAEPREQGNLRYTLEWVLGRSVQSLASQKSMIHLGLRFGSPKDRAQHSRAQQSTSHHITPQHRTWHSTAGR